MRGWVRMSKKNKKTLVPNLRFPEFRGKGEWEKIKLIDTADKKKKWSFIGGPFGSNLKSSDYTETGVRIIQLQNIGDAEFIDTYKIFTSEEKANELLSCNIHPCEIILSKMGDPVGRACLIPNYHTRYVMCSDGIRLVVNENLYSKYFIYSLINSDQFRSTIENNSTGSTRKRIGLDVLRNLPMSVPKRQEQQKIADCLTSLDELITAEAGKLEALKSHKKGLMQKLFPAEGETVPEWRFPEFRGKGEWEVKPLDDIAFFYKGKGISKSDIDPQGETPCIRYGELYTIYDEVIGEVFSKTKLPSSELFLCKSNDVLIPSSGETKIDIAKASCVLLNDVALGGDLNVLRSNTNGIFLSYLLNGAYKREIAKKAQGDTIVHLYASQLKLLNIMIPMEAEQQKIAYCLTSLDELITAQSQKIEALKAHKKGLMQGLFPPADEVGV
ncbi:type I restriction modification DNA specificity domain protein [Candidatus Magnetomorum sp. HK-1]|nr:type I restriction modification DNA specificity domain protein [Candidatus Magnetomorum sp. HK-1]